MFDWRRNAIAAWLSAFGAVIVVLGNLLSVERALA
jgi:hypothetical protein